MAVLAIVPGLGGHPAAAAHPAVATTAATLHVLGAGVWTTLGALANLWNTPWGRLLAAKLLPVIGMLALGYRHWRTSERAVSSSDRASRMT